MRPWLWWLAPLCLTLSLSACAENIPPESEPLLPSAPADEPAVETGVAFEPETAVYRCQAPAGEIRLVTRTRPNGLQIFLPPEIDSVYLDCEHDRRASIWEHAKLNGVDFRAVGNEPGWVLEIRDGNRLDLSYDYGQSSLSLPITETRSDAATRTTTYVASNRSNGEQTMIVTLSGEGCSDTMSDETFPTRVKVEFDGRSLSGCGRPLH